MQVIRVESIQDLRLAEYREVRDADLAARRGLFLAEGEVVVRVLLGRGRLAVRSVFLSEARLGAMAGALAALGPRVPIYVAPQGVMDGVVGFAMHRGVLAAGERPAGGGGATELLASLGPGPRLIVALEGLANPDNVGGVFRNAAAFGADAVLLDGGSCDPLYRKAIRVSVGASLFVPFARGGSPGDLVGALRAAGFWVMALTKGGEQDAASLGQGAPLPARLALVAGAEGHGLSRATLDGADARLAVSMEAGFDSLNVATATGIALHAVRALRQKGAAPGGDQKVPTAAR